MTTDTEKPVKRTYVAPVLERLIITRHLIDDGIGSTDFVATASQVTIDQDDKR